MKHVVPAVAALGLVGGTLAGHAASFTVSASAGTGRSGSVSSQSGDYNPRTSQGLVTVQSATADKSGSFADTSHTPPWWRGDEQAVARAATYGTDLSLAATPHPGLLGYAVEPMADTMVSGSCSATGGPTSASAGGRAYAVAEVRHRVVARPYPDQLKGVLDPLAVIPIRLKYRVEIQTRTSGHGREYYWNSGGSLKVQGNDVSFADSIGAYSLGTGGKGGSIEDTRSFNLRRYSSTATTNLYTIRVVAETIVNVDVSSSEPNASGSAVIFGQVIIDPFLQVDPAWEYAPYFMVQQESLRQPGEWAEVTRGWQPPEPTLGPPGPWHFELAEGRPSRLVWSTQAGRTYELWYTDAWSTPWQRMSGFPRAGTGEPMKVPVPAGDRGFFQITSEDGFALVPGGTFPMGDPTGPGYEGETDERPLHEVEVGPFLIGRFEVTKALWDVVVRWAETNGYDLTLSSAGGKRSDHPAHGVSWDKSLKWCNARSEQEGLRPCYTLSGSVYRSGSATNVVGDFGAAGYRLPTEAEWEKAARDGFRGKRYPWGTDTISHAEANYEAQGTAFGNLSGDAGHHPAWDNGSAPYTSPVGWFPGNPLGLHDLAGNLWEWCWDRYGEGFYAESPARDPRGPATGSKRVIRGGAWLAVGPGDCRTASRDSATPTGNFNDIGFRLVRTASPPTP